MKDFCRTCEVILSLRRRSPGFDMVYCKTYVCLEFQLSRKVGVIECSRTVVGGEGVTPCLCRQGAVITPLTSGPPISNECRCVGLFSVFRP